MITPAQLARIKHLPPAQQVEFLDIIEELTASQITDEARAHFIPYMKYLWPGFIDGNHHKVMGEAFDRVLDKKLKRLIINMGPRHTKSESASIYLPSKWFGRYPESKILQTSHTANLAAGFGRKVRNLVATRKYQLLYPETTLIPDSKAAGKWSTSKGGEYNAIGVGGNVAGVGGDLVIVDDPHSEQDYLAARAGDSSAFDKVFEWYQTGPRQRLQPDACLVIVMTRWHTRDLTGRLLKRMQNGGKDQWELIEFPALMPDTDLPLWPEFWSYEELAATRDELSPQQWNAQYLQNPTSEEGALVKREWWKTWEEDDPPECEFIIQSWDTAFSAKESADYCACTTWGVFYLIDEDTGQRQANIILLDAFRERMEFPKLKKTALQMYKDRMPDAFIIEAKASGTPLIQELRRMGIPVQEFTPTRGNDKIVRVNAITDLFFSGLVWAPDRNWADDVKEEFATHPFGDNDDYLDSGTQALARFRNGGFIVLPSDEDEEERVHKTADYY
jgi:predicted phage terminase large subunit-like protein